MSKVLVISYIEASSSPPCSSSRSPGPSGATSSKRRSGASRPAFRALRTFGTFRKPSKIPENPIKSHQKPSKTMKNPPFSPRTPPQTPSEATPPTPASPRGNFLCGHEGDADLAGLVQLHTGALGLWPRIPKSYLADYAQDGKAPLLTAQHWCTAPRKSR